MNFNTDVSMWRDQKPVRILSGFVFWADEKSNAPSEAVARFDDTAAAQRCMSEAGVIVISAA